MQNSEATLTRWFHVKDAEAISSPALLVYPRRIEENLRRMLAIAGNPDRLRPHIKTAKMKEVVELARRLGITRFKCATIAEAEMAARVGVPDLLLAYQPVGPAVRRVVALVNQFPNTAFSVTCDDEPTIRSLSSALEGSNNRGTPGQRQPPVSLEILVDLDIGQHRTGVPAGAAAAELYHLANKLPGLKPGGLHAYDGHITDSDPDARQAACEAAFGPVKTLRERLRQEGRLLRVVAGGTPTFPIHARRGDVECSPGTCVFWDAGYGRKLQDLPFEPAALLLTRVISKPGPGRLCLDLGHKAVASEMPHPRVQFLTLPDAKAVLHSEEHLVVESAHSDELRVGDCLYAVPWHICPTVALHASAVVIEDGRTAGSWKVAARDRYLTI